MVDFMRFIGVTKNALTAGPGKRLELFTKGCIRGVVSPCEGCFNQTTWTFEGKYRKLTINEIIEIIDRDAWNRQVTFCGGEPILQGRAIGKVAKELKKKDPTFHNVMYTMYKLDVLMKHGLNFYWSKERHQDAMLEQLKDYSSSYEIKKTDVEGNPLLVKFEILTPDDILELMRHIDIIVDGEYKHEQRLTIAKYMHDGGFIGSANQRVIFASDTMMNQNGENQIIYKYADEYMNEFNSSDHCKACGVSTQTENYCSSLCKERYKKHLEESL